MTTNLIKQENIGQFNVRVLKDDNNDYTVIYSANGKDLEIYECDNSQEATRDYNTIRRAIRDVLKVIKESLGD